MNRNEKEPKKSPALTGIFSALVPGLGQWLNREKYKGCFFFAGILLCLLTEFFSSTYLKAFSELRTYPHEGVFYLFRDYGGFISKGLWGFITLGKMTLGTQYRGNALVVFDKNIPWMAADNSYKLLGTGVIALILVLIFCTLWVVSIIDAYRTRKKINNGFIPLSWQKYRKVFLNDMFAYILLIPAAVIIILFTFIPFFYTFVVSFTNFINLQNPNFPLELMQWRGLETFREVFSNNELMYYFKGVLVWTLTYSFFGSVIAYIIGFVHAIVIDSRFVKRKRLFRNLNIIPWAIPVLVCFMAFRNVFAYNGLVNNLLISSGNAENAQIFLKSIGLFGQEVGVNNYIEFLNEPLNGPLAKCIIILVNVWHGAPYFMLLITGALTTIPASLYEAAKIDGAKDGQRFRYITLPYVLTATAPVIITTFTHNFNNFGAVYYLTGGGPNQIYDLIPSSMRGTALVPGQTDLLVSWIFKIAFNEQRDNAYNIASVYTIFIFVVVTAFALWNLSRVKSFWED